MRALWALYMGEKERAREEEEEEKKKILYSIKRSHA
jgi:hypothetical protein